MGNVSRLHCEISGVLLLAFALRCRPTGIHRARGMQWRALQQCMPTSRKKQGPCLPWSCLQLSAPPKAQLSRQVQI